MNTYDLPTLDSTCQICKEDKKMKERKNRKKDNELSYGGIHTWLRRKFGKAKECEICQKSYCRNYQWALKKGFSYIRRRDYFFQLCVSCHRKYDYTNQQRKKISLSLRRQNGRARKRIIQYNLKREIIQRYESLTIASKITGIHIANISQNLKNIRKTSGGFIWEYDNSQK